MSSEIIVAVITVLGSVAGVFIQNNKHNKRIGELIEYRIKELEKKQDKHNQLIERVYSIEKSVDVLDERIKVANNRIGDLEKNA